MEPRKRKRIIDNHKLSKLYYIYIGKRSKRTEEVGIDKKKSAEERYIIKPIYRLKKK